MNSDTAQVDSARLEAQLYFGGYSSNHTFTSCRHCYAQCTKVGYMRLDKITMQKPLLACINDSSFYAVSKYGIPYAMQAMYESHCP